MTDLKEEKNGFNPKINIGIDFGTNGTAIGYSIPGGNVVYIFSKWGKCNNTGNTETKKTRTAILLDKNGHCVAFGLSAITKYLIYTYSSNFDYILNIFYLCLMQVW